MPNAFSDRSPLAFKYSLLLLKLQRNIDTTPSLSKQIFLIEDQIDYMVAELRKIGLIEQQFHDVVTDLTPRKPEPQKHAIPERLEQNLQAQARDIEKALGERIQLLSKTLTDAGIKHDLQTLGALYMQSIPDHTESPAALECIEKLDSDISAFINGESNAPSSPGTSSSGSR